MTIFNYYFVFLQLIKAKLKQSNFERNAKKILGHLNTFHRATLKRIASYYNLSNWYKCQIGSSEVCPFNTGLSSISSKLFSPKMKKKHNENKQLVYSPRNDCDWKFSNSILIEIVLKINCSTKLCGFLFGGINRSFVR